ncbi:MAG: DNA-processing protein DprA [Candidatus Omnitrophica bacterium]|nr:DNA-processing protein DprA [Candidatus Omnitrophota bacterium]
MTELEAKIALNMLPEIGSIRIKKLLDYYKSAKAVIEASPLELNRICSLPKNKTFNFSSSFKSVNLKRELELIEKLKVNVISIDNPEYPELLKNVYDPPPILYAKGKLPQKSINIAIVGSRRASGYGLKMAKKLSYELASCSITIVSGMARGIDTAAHNGSLQARGQTIAVLGSGLSYIYPPENKNLFAQIAESGAVISEFPMQTRPNPGNFPRRNRIISGLSLGVLVVEAAKRSGALITARCALEEGRDVFAIPGEADSETSLGTNQLIKDGAKLVDSFEEIISELNIDIRTSLLKDKKEAETKADIP